LLWLNLLESLEFEKIEADSVPSVEVSMEKFGILKGQAM
jgi:hypothetical protein